MDEIDDHSASNMDESDTNSIGTLSKQNQFLLLLPNCCKYVFSQQIWTRLINLKLLSLTTNFCLSLISTQKTVQKN